ncbi:hypothetical protein GUJ16_13760 [Enterococcus hirae]|nr:hypothetical protein [Enterococcus hirae]
MTHSKSTTATIPSGAILRTVSDMAIAMMPMQHVVTTALRLLQRKPMRIIIEPSRVGVGRSEMQL